MSKIVRKINKDGAPVGPYMIEIGSERNGMYVTPIAFKGDVYFIDKNQLKEYKVVYINVQEDIVKRAVRQGFHFNCYAVTLNLTKQSERLREEDYDLVCLMNLKSKERVFLKVESVRKVVKTETTLWPSTIRKMFIKLFVLETITQRYK